MKMKISIKSNYKLFMILSVSMLMAIMVLACTVKADGLSTISPKEAYNLIQNNKSNPDFVLIDIRTPQEFKSGHLKNAILIDYYSKDFLKKMKSLDKNKTYLIYCRSANRSTKTLKKIKNMKFTSLYNMGKGIKGWAKAGFPIYKDKKN
jgi:rhodanese-related sulfurtransferase